MNEEVSLQTGKGSPSSRIFLSNSPRWIPSSSAASTRKMMPSSGQACVSYSGFLGRVQGNSSLLSLDSFLGKGEN